MKKEKNENLLKYSLNSPWQFALVVLLYLVGAVSFPINIFTFFMQGYFSAEMVAILIARLICCILPVYLIYSLHLENIFNLKGLLKKALLIIPFLLVSINNFPFIAIFTKNASFTTEKWDAWLFYILAVLSGVLLEELTFRGVILPTLYRKLKNKKNGAFLAVLYTSLLFGAVHLFNLFAGASPISVIMQIGYSFLIGGMCAIALLKTGSFYSAVVLHFIFNIGGMLIDYKMLSGHIWDLTTIIITAVLAVLVIIYAIYLLLKGSNCLFDEKIVIPEGEKTNVE